MEVATGPHFISSKIGGTHLGSMEIRMGLTRVLIAAVRGSIKSGRESYQAKANENPIKIHKAQNMIVYYSLELALECIINSFCGYVLCITLFFWKKSSSIISFPARY